MKSRVVFASSFVIGGLLALSLNASAFQRRTHGSSCQDGNHSYINGENQSSSAQNQPLYCSIPDDTSMAKHQINTANAHVYHGSSTAPVYAWACVDYWHSIGGGCGNWVSANSPGNVVTLSPPRTYWSATYASDFGYMYITTPQHSRLQGIYLAN